MKFLGNIAVLILGCIAGALLIELGLRVVPTSMLPREFRVLDGSYSGRVKWEQMMEGDPYLGYHYRPGLDVSFPSEGKQISIRTVDYGLGNIGFRDIGAKAPFAGITLGDSFSFCDDVSAEDCWIRQLGDRSGLSVASLGVSGYSTMAEARLLKRYGAQLKPRIVLASVFANDFSDNLDFAEWLKSGSQNFWEWRADRERPGALFRWLVDHSKIVRLVDSASRSRGRHIYQVKRDRLDLVFQPWWVEPLSDARKEDRAAGWALMRDAFLDMRTSAEAMGAKLVLVLIPTKEEVYFDSVRAELPNAAKLSVDRPYDVVRQFCRDQGIVCCDTTPALQEHARQGDQVYLRVSGHWNALGGQVGAEAVNECLMKAGLAADTRQVASN